MSKLEVFYHVLIGLCGALISGVPALFFLSMALDHFSSDGGKMQNTHGWALLTFGMIWLIGALAGFHKAYKAIKTYREK